MDTGKPDPFQFMIENRKTIIEVLEQSSTLNSAWNTLTERLPEIKTITKFNTFKGYARILNVVDGKFAELKEENIKLSEELGKVRQEKNGLEKELGMVRQLINERMEAKVEKNEMGDKGVLVIHKNPPNLLPNLGMDSVPKRVNGWGVQLRGQYYRLFKKIKGKVKWIHIGKNWDIGIARKKIERYSEGAVRVYN